MAEKDTSLKSYWIALFLQKAHSAPWCSFTDKEQAVIVHI